MTHTFEIREEPSKEYRRQPFVIYNEKNVRVGRHYATREEAQSDIDVWTKPAEIPSDPALDELLDKYEGKGLLETEQKETESVITIDSQETVGSIIEFHGDRWTVIRSEYITEQEATEIEEMHDAYVSPGWHTVIKKVMHEGDAVIVTGSGYGVIVKQYEKTVRVRLLFGSEEDVDSRYVEPAAPSMAEQIKAQVKAQKGK